MTSTDRKFRKSLNAGLVGLVLLAVLEASDEDLYGYDIAKRLRRVSATARRTAWRATRDFIDAIV